MQYTLVINQPRAVEWGLNLPQAAAFAFFFNLSTWATAVPAGGRVFHIIDRAKAVHELPIVTDKPDTIYRIAKQLEEKGIVELRRVGNRWALRITSKGSAWNSTQDLGEQFVLDHPERVGKKSEVGKISEATRKNIRESTEKNPTYSITNNPNTISGVTPRGARLPSGSVLPDEYAAWAASELGVSRQHCETVWQKFHDYWIAVPGSRGVKLDWFATWRNWIRKEVSDGGKNGAGGQGGAGGNASGRQQVQQALSEWDRLDWAGE